MKQCAACNINYVTISDLESYYSLFNTPASKNLNSIKKSFGWFQTKFMHIQKFKNSSCKTFGSISKHTKLRTAFKKSRH